MNEASLHRIRLPKPWTSTTTTTTDPHSDRVLTTHEFGRNFQCPSGLLDNSSIELEIQVDDDAESLQHIECSLNAHVLEVTVKSASLSRVVIQRDSLQPINRLAVRLTWRGDRPAAVLPQVSLLIGP